MFKRAQADMNVETFTTGVQLAVRAAAAAGLSIAIARLLGLEYPIYSFLAAVIATDLSPSQSRQLGLRRLGATVVGAACGATLSPLLAPGAWAIAIGILVAMLISQLLQAREGAKVAGYICGIVLLDHSAEPWLYAYFRLIETGLGVAAAWMVSYVPKLIRTEQSGLGRTS
jgi:uncharacterized membrane protein YgaE (UPF0421/DUF939 family)